MADSTSTAGALQTAAGKYKYVRPYLRWLGRSLAKMLSQRRYPAALGLLTEELTGTDLYLEALRRCSRDGLVRQQLDHGEMVLDLGDVGLSRRLLRYGVHEEASTRAYRRELEQLRDDVDGELGVLELSANLGYFLLVAADALGGRATFHAVEPHPRNMSLLRENVRLNGLADRVTLVEGGVGGTSRPAELHVMPQSNWHTVGEVVDDYPCAVESIPVDLSTVDDLLAQAGLEPADVHVVRFDIEDFETEVFDGMRGILRSETPLVLFVELHLRRHDDDTRQQMLEMLDRSGLEIASAVAYDTIEWDGRPIDVDRFVDLPAGHSVEVVARR